MKVAVFDFCNTIVNFQTADRFVYYVVQHSENWRIEKRKKVLDFIQKCSFVRNFDKVTKGKYSLNKRVILWQIRGIDQNKIEALAKDYYWNEIVPNLHKDVIELMEEYRKRGWQIWLASGGYDVYLKFFVQDYHVDGCCCTRLRFAKGVFSGRMEGEDCMREKKVKLMEKCFPSNVEESVAYSDSKSDLPLLFWADKGIVVSKEKHRTWVEENGLEEYILTNAKHIRGEKSK